MMISAKQFFIEPFEYEHPQHFLKSQWQKNHKSVKFMTYRWILVACFLVLVGLVVFDFKLKFQFFFISFANLNLLATFCLTILGTVLTTMFNREMITNLTEMSKASKVYWYLWTQCLVFSVLYSIFFWFVIYKESFDITHVVNAIVHPILLFIDLFVVKNPARYYNYFYMVIAEIIIVLLTVIYQFAGGDNGNGGNFVNHFCDWKNSPTTALTTAVVLMFGSIALHCLINKIHKLRKTLHLYLKIKRAMRNAYIRIP